MKSINLESITNQKEINISVLNKTYKFEIIPFKLDEHGNRFEVYDTRVTREDKLSVICDIKSLRGSIGNIKFTFESLDKEMRLRKYTEKQNNINFINKLSLNYNNKNWFNINENSIIDKDGHIKIEILEQTCILSNKITENSIINYISNNNKKWTKKYILEHLDPKHSIVKTNWTRNDIIKRFNV